MKKDRQIRDLEEKLMVSAMGGGEVSEFTTLLDELALHSPDWRDLKYRAQRLLNPLPRLPDMARALPLPAPDKFGQYGEFKVYEDSVMHGIAA